MLIIKSTPLVLYDIHLMYDSNEQQVTPVIYDYFVLWYVLSSIVCQVFF